MDGGRDAGLDHELAGCSFADERLNKRLRKLVAQIGSAMGQSIPLVCQDWANTKAAYRFFSNDRVSEADILAGHFQSTRDRTLATDGPVLVLHDTTEFTYQRENTDAIGVTKSINSGRDKAGRLITSTRAIAPSLALVQAPFCIETAASATWPSVILDRKLNPVSVWGAVIKTGRRAVVRGAGWHDPLRGQCLIAIKKVIDRSELHLEVIHTRNGRIALT
jgi:hypothetical protein